MDRLKIKNYYTKLKIKKESQCKWRVMKLVSVIEKKKWKRGKKGTANVFGK